MDERAAKVAAAGGRFVYYTTAETAKHILKEKQIWLRSTAAMNDYMEVDHGFECLQPAYDGELGGRLRSALDACFPGLGSELTGYFNGWLPHIRRDTYMTCVSEHFDSEDQHGRLSMWRAYGGQAGVALVLNGDVMFSESDVLGAYASPVAYLDPAEFAVEFSKVVTNIEGEAEYMRTLGRDMVKHIMFRILRFAVLCTKHREFHEEREWRIIASPTMYQSPLLVPSVEVVRGTPQTVLKITLQNHPEEGLVGLALPDLLNRIIIGPCEFPQVILTAFYRLLDDAGVADPGKKVVVSDIPLRNP